MKRAVQRMLTAEDHAADDRRIYTDQLAHIMVVELLIELQRTKRENSVLEAKLKIEAARHQRMTSGRIR